MNKVVTALRWLGKRWFNLICTVLIVLLLGLLDMRIVERDNSSGITTVGIGQKTVTIGSAAEAAGSVDYTFGVANANVQFQAAINALPATGGRLVVVSTGNINFAALAAVTRAIDNVVIEGSGRGSYFLGDGVTSPFTAGGNNWVLTNIRVNVNAATLLAAMGATTGWMWTNVATSDTYFAYRSPSGQSRLNDVTVASLTDSGLTPGGIAIAGVGGLLGTDAAMTFTGTTTTMTTANITTINAPTGRATLTVAADDTPAVMKTQADYVCDGVGDNVQIQAATDALSASGGGTVFLLPGHFWIASAYLPKSYVNLAGSGTQVSTLCQDAAGHTINGYDSNNGQHDIVFRDFSIDGRASHGGAGFGMVVKGYYNIVIEDVEIFDTGESGIRGDNNCHDWRMARVRVHDTAANKYGMSFYATTADIYRFWIDDSETFNVGAGGVLFAGTMGGAVHDVWITDHYASNCSLNGIWVSSDNTTTRNYNIHLDNPTSIGATNDGILIIRGQDIVINNLVCRSNGADGIVIDSCNNTAVNGGTSSLNGACGLYATDDTDAAMGNSNLTITGGLYSDNDQAAGGFSGILITDTTRVAVTGSRIYDGQVAKTQEYGVRETGSSDWNVIVGNNTGPHVTANITTVGGNTIKEHNIE